ncbi:hypothetical protein TrispH2_008647 [Trichoplax sp. H2]|nr:hypothetical protein TrispH2_008647 [Trichoplax sp. H2]|eukprot:RDD38059.1 hypothetical protein TrispH2_008647 [Trichoplax sp. H2]
MLYRHEKKANVIVLLLYKRGNKIRVEMFSESLLKYPYISEMCKTNFIGQVDFSSQIYKRHKMTLMPTVESTNASLPSGTAIVPTNDIECKVSLKFCSRHCLIENKPIGSKYYDEDDYACTKVAYNCSLPCK